MCAKFGASTLPRYGDIAREKMGAELWPQRLAGGAEAQRPPVKYLYLIVFPSVRIELCIFVTLRAQCVSLTSGQTRSRARGGTGRLYIVLYRVSRKKRLLLFSVINYEVFPQK